jgi:hypothetical protein
MPTTALARKLARKTGSELSDQTAGQLGIILHYGFAARGRACGPTACQPRQRPTLKAALTVAATMEIAVDQLANTALGLTAPTGNDAQPGQRQGDARRQPNPRHRVGDCSDAEADRQPDHREQPEETNRDQAADRQPLDDSRGRGRQPVLVRAEVEGEKRG